MACQNWQPAQVKNNKIFIDDFFRSDVDPNYVGNGLRTPDMCSDNPPKDWIGNGYTCTNRRRASCYVGSDRFQKLTVLCVSCSIRLLALGAFIWEVRANHGCEFLNDH